MDLVKLREKLMPAVAAFIPLVEFYYARSVHRNRLDLYEQPAFMIGLSVAFFAFYLIFNSFGPLRLQKKILKINLLLLLLPLMRYTVVPIHFEWIGLVWMSIVLSGFCLFAEPRRLLTHVRANTPILWFLGAIYAAQSLYHAMRFIKWFNVTIWYDNLSGFVVGSVRFLLGLMQYNILPAQHPRFIKSPDLTIYVNAACSGLEGIVFFVAVFSCMMMLDYKTIPLKKILVGYAVGIVLMMALNILRITLFFMFGVWATQQWGGEAGSQAIVDLFHNNIGWLLYMIGIAAFFFFFYEYVDKDKKKPVAAPTTRP